MTGWCALLHLCSIHAILRRALGPNFCGADTQKISARLKFCKDPSRGVDEISWHKKATFAKQGITIWLLNKIMEVVTTVTNQTGPCQTFMPVQHMIVEYMQQRYPARCYW